MSVCQLTPGCELGAHRADEHPCGQKAEAPGSLCRFCTADVPMDGSPCPACWTPVPTALADLKALFADIGLSVERDA